MTSRRPKRTLHLGLKGVGGPLVFALTLLAPVVSLIIAPVPLSLDGPSHVYSAVAIRSWFTGDALYRRYFDVNSLLTPNWLGTALLALTTVPGVSRWTVVAMNIACIFFVCGALCVLIDRTGSALESGERCFYTLAAITPLAVSVLIIVGFWNFLLSTALSVVATGLPRKDTGWRRRLCLWGCVLLSCWAHPLPVLLFAAAPCLAYLLALFELRHGGIRVALRRTKMQAVDLLPWVASGLLIMAFVSRLTAHNPSSQTPLLEGMESRLFGVITLQAFRELAPSSSTRGLYIVYVALLVFGAFAQRGSPAGRSALRPLTVLLLVAYFVAPDRIGNGSYIPQRILWLAILITGVLAVSSTTKVAGDLLWSRCCALIAALITTVFAIQYLSASRSMATPVEELRGAMAQIPSHSTVLLLDYRLTPNCPRDYLLEITQPERHLPVLEGAFREFVVLNDYEPASEDFPLVYRSFEYSSIIDDYRFSAFEADQWRKALSQGTPADYVLSWGVPNGNSGCGDANHAPLTDELSRYYELRFERRASSRIQVWRNWRKPH